MIEFLLILTVILVVYISTKYFKAFCAAKLKIRLFFDDDKTTEQEAVILNIEAINKKFLIIPIFKINIFINKNIELEDKSLKEDLDNEDFYTYTVVTSLLSYQRVKKTVILKPIKRGYYTISANVTLIDLFGLSKMSLAIKDEIELFVSPKPKKLEEYIYDSTSLQGNTIVKRWISPDPIFYSGVRPYDTHDSFKDIDWKSTAKLGELYVKKFDFTSDPSVMIFVDVYSGSELSTYDEIYIENAISFAASLVNHAYKNKVPVGFGTNSYMKHYVKNIVYPDMGLNNIILINDMLTCMEYKSFDTFKNTMDKYIRSFVDNNVIVFIKYEMSGYLYKISKFLSSRNYKVQIFLYKNNDIQLNDKNIRISYLK